MKHNQIRAGIVLSYTSTVLTILIQLVYTPVMIRLLGQNEYGLYTLVAGVVSYLSLFNLGLNSAYLRFYARCRAENKEDALARLNGMFLVIFLVLAAAAAGVGMGLAQYPRQVFGSKLTEAELRQAVVLMRILVVNIALTFPSGLLSAMAYANERFIHQKILDFLGVVVNPFLVLPLLLMGYRSTAVVAVTTAITAAKLIWNGIYCLRTLRIRFSFHRFEGSLLREIGAFSFFIFLNMIIDQINWNVDKFILGRVAGTAVVAVYGLGAQMNAVFIDFLTTVSTIYAPRINQLAHERDYHRAYSDLFVRVGRLQFMVLWLLVSGFLFFGRVFITEIYVGPEYEQAYWVTLLLVLPELIALVQSLGVEIQRALNVHQFQSVAYFIMALVNLCMTVPLAGRFGALGAAGATAVSLLLCHGLIMNLYYARVLKLDIRGFWRSLLKLARAMLVPLAAGVGLSRIPYRGIPLYLAELLIYTAVYGASLWLFGMNPEEKQLLRARIHRRKEC